MFKKLLFCLTCCAFLLGSKAPEAWAQESNKAAKPEFVFGKSALADYLFFLFYKDTKDYTLDSALVRQVKALPGLNPLIALPEIVATTGVNQYADLYPLAERYFSRPDTLRQPKDKGYRMLNHSRTYPRYSELVRVLKAGEALYPTFVAQWQRNVEPKIDNNLATWARQDQELNVAAKFEKLTRLRFRSPRLYAYCLGFHLSASGNYSPTSLYTEPWNKPNLAWFVGHEGTHVLLNAQEGNDWRRHPSAARAVAAAVKRGVNANTIEETTCLFMQLALSQECGLSDRAQRLSSDFKGKLSAEDAFKQQLLQTMEQRWAAYQADRRKTLVNFMVESTLAAFAAEAAAR